MRQLAIVIVVLATFWTVSFATYANDGIGTLALGGVVIYGKTDLVSMQKEVLEIGTNRINVSYEFVNESDVPVTLPVVFPLPSYWGIVPSPTYGGQPPNFSLIVDGEARQFDVGIRATCRSCGKRLKNADVTDELRTIGLSREQIAILPGAFDKPGDRKSMFDETKGLAHPVTPSQMKKLRAVGLIEHDPNGLGEGEPDFPAWEVHVTYAWTITFPPGKVVSVKHSYSPFLGLGSVGDLYRPDIEKETLTSICGSSALSNRLSKLTPENSSIPGAKVGYVLKTANTWKGAIKSFTLRLKKSSPNEIVSLCFPGSFTKVDSLTLESRMTDFVPSSDLLIQFLDPTRSIRYGESFAGYGEAPRLSGEPFR